MGILKKYELFRESQKRLREALSMAINGECDGWWLNSCIEAFELIKMEIRRGGKW